MTRAAAALALALRAFAVSPAPPAAVPAVRFLSPGEGDAVLGRTEIALEASPPEGARILKIEIYADDRLIATLLDPPWSHVWDAGDTLKARTLRARAFASDGTTFSHKVTTRAIAGVQRAAVTLVEVYCTVRNAQGRYVTDLRQTEFTVLESNRPQEIAVFSAERKPAHLALVLDTSNSMRQDGRIEVAREAAAGFVEALEPGDTAALIVFDNAPRLLVPRSGDRAGITRAIQALEPAGGTALYDALAAAAELLRPVEGRKAIILLSDGRDESVDGLGPGSLRTFEEARDAVLASEVAVYAVAIGEKLAEEMDVTQRRTLGEILTTLSEGSGGRAYFVKKASQLKPSYRSIGDELRHQYLLGYYPPAEPAGRADGWREIRVKVARPRLKVAARSGYFAR